MTQKYFSTKIIAETAGKISAEMFLIALLVLAPLFSFPALAQTREELKTELEKIEEQISAYEKELSKTQTAKKTLTNKINQLKKEQAKLSLQIKSTNLQISEINRQLSDVGESIRESNQKISQFKEQIAEFIRLIHEQDRKSFLFILMQEGGLAAVLEETGSLAQITDNLSLALKNITAAKEELNVKLSDLEVKQDDKKGLLSVQILQSHNLQGKTDEQTTILQETKGKEANYQKMLSASQKRAQEIKNRLYELLGISTRINFGQAVEIANWVSKETGVRPAMLLAILTQESNLGKNVGTCNRPGDPDSKSWKEIMKPNRDQEPFLAITKELGLDPDITPVSCPMRDSRGNRVGWGGAMGPAQFIPSTWMLYKDKISAITGKKPANPWDIRDAFTATGLLLKNNGAVAGDENSEWKAAMRYFSGGTSTKYRFYGDNVLALAKQYEEDIKEMD